MSNFRSKAFNPASKRVEDAEYCDDYYGRHRYGIRFDDGCVHPEAQCGIDAAATAIDSLLKEQDALQARVKELDGRYLGAVAARGMLRDRADEAESRAARLQQERDEAYERAGKIITSWWAKNHPPVMKRNSELERAIAEILTAIRRLSGPEKDGK